MSDDQTNQPVHVFEPSTDITAYELAVILARFKLTLPAKVVARLPEPARRHFVRADD